MIVVVPPSKHTSLFPAVFLDDTLKLWQLVVCNGDQRLCGAEPGEACRQQAGGNPLLPELRFNEKRAKFTFTFARSLQS